jgi:chemotaxis protein MotB
MRKTKGASHENHERWLVSYADFITLLFAFFVVMFASSQTDKAHARAISQAIEKALKNGSLGPILTTMLNPPAELDHKTKLPKIVDSPQSAEADLAESLKVLNSTLAEEIRKGAVRLSLEHRGLIIGLQAAAFFPSGGDAIASSALGSVGKVADVLNKLPNPLRLEGHTDSLPISNSRFQSNWELSAARSIAMLRLLNERFAVATKRMAIVGYADTDSIDSNDTEQGRGRNRRVDIVVVSRYGMQAEPTPGTAPPNTEKPGHASEQTPSAQKH